MSGEGGRAPLQVKKSEFRWVVEKNVFNGRRWANISAGLNQLPTEGFGFDNESYWSLHVGYHSGPDGKTWVTLHLYTFPGREVMRTKVKLGLIAKDGTEKNVNCNRKINGNWNLDEFITLDSLLDEENGYFEDDEVIIFGIFEVYRNLEIPESTLDSDLSRMFESGDFSDFTLVVGAEEIRAHKCVLASRSSFFHQKLHNNTEEGRSGRWEIKFMNVAEVKEWIKPFYTKKVIGFKSGDFSDVTVVVGGEELKLHKFVLSSRSPVLEAMFQHDMKENKEGRLEIEDLDVVGVKGLVSFLYTDEVDLSEIADKVLPAANKYGVERLKILCEQELCHEIDDENVTDLLKLADLYEAKQLKKLALAYIRANSEEVVKQAGFRDLKESNRDRKLFEEVCAIAYNQINMVNLIGFSTN